MTVRTWILIVTAENVSLEGGRPVFCSWCEAAPGVDGRRLSGRGIRELYKRMNSGVEVREVDGR
jgi:hypothetical protein